MDTHAFESELKRDGYDVMTNTTPGAKVNPSEWKAVKKDATAAEKTADAK